MDATVSSPLLHAVIDEKREIVEIFATRKQARVFRSEFNEIYKFSKARVVHLDHQQKPGDRYV
jgi:hypothetical protein